MIRNLLAAVGLVTLALAGAAGLNAYGAFDDDRPVRVPVSYAGLDLATPEGQRILGGRIDAAVDDICDTRGTAGLSGSTDVRRCRRDAYASVRPQVAQAIAAARSRYRGDDRRWDGRVDDRVDRRDRASGTIWEDAAPEPDERWTDPTQEDPMVGDRAIDTDRWARRADDVPPPPPPPAIAPGTPPAPGMRLLRRTTTVTRTVSNGGIATAPAPAPTARARKPAPRAATVARYRRHPVAGSYLPPAAWRAAERAQVRAFATGRLTRWMVAGREGYVRVSAPRRIDGCTCRNVRVVKYGWGKQIVVASGTRCRLPGGSLR